MILWLGCRAAEGVLTTTSASIAEDATIFHAGDTITIRARVDPRPPENGDPVVVFVVAPLRGGGAPAEAMVGGIAEHGFVCGSTEVPFGEHTAGATFLGVGNHGPSESGLTLSFQCLP